MVALLVCSTALLAVPRGAAPDLFPVPLVDVREARATRAASAALAERAEREGLPFEARAVGDAMRRLGSALAAQDLATAEHVRRLLAERVAAVLRARQLEPLLRLRAVQTQWFVRAVREHHWGGKASPELQALGGDFPARALRNGWAGPAGCLASDDELRTLFEVRWAELARLRDEPHFKPTLADWRRYYRFLLLHPERGAASGGEGEFAGQELNQQRLRYAEALARHDRDYPAQLARGTLLARLGRRPEAAQALTGFLNRPAGGDWALRARNYLLHAADGAEGEEF